MLNNLKIAMVILVVLLSGCGTVIRHLDATWFNNKTVYKKPKPLPPLEIPPELAASSSRIQQQPLQ